MQGRNKGKVLADKNADDNILNNAFDGDVTTFYKASNNNTNIVIDYGQKTVLEQVKITPKLNDSPNASIVAGRKYELNYWANGYWKPIFTVVPDTNTITFNGLPKKGLFLLKALSRSDESRIFTIDGGKQKWF
ncbi:hypothetical protein QF042_003787 [Pedobacter sp. W3I1]|uniref:discoidin domain-containing protein n=1 Tax=Pedobacter sp. W3I1 TaxID=3042291 RepID=UPI002781D63C|nr:hypothetical protein [Pedobacter sp. W3I1]MDQ0640222.1 hypothetical protein [Pedobacter sp. W3I1]